MLNHLHTFKLFLIKNPFLKDSSFIFVANIANSLLNYGLILMVGRLLLKEQLSQWVIIGSFITLLSSFSSGIKLFYVKRVSSLEHKQKGLGLAYRNFVFKWVLLLLFVIFITSPLTAYLVQRFGLPNQPYWLIFLALNQVFISFTGGLSQHFLMGILAIRQYATASIAGTLARLVATLVLIFLNFGAFALPLGMLFNVLLIFTLSTYFVNQKKKKGELKEVSESDKPVFNIKQELLGSQATALFLFFLMGFFTLSNFFADRFLSVTEKDVFAVIYSFGQMLHFGPVAFLTALIPYSSRTKDNKIILQATAVTGLLTLGGILTFVLFGNLFLWLIGRTQYAEFLPLVWVYGIFILGYNIVYLATKTLIAKSGFKKLLVLPILITLYAGLMWVVASGFVIIPNFYIFLKNLLTSASKPVESFNDLQSLIVVNIFFGILAGITMFYQAVSKE